MINPRFSSNSEEESATFGRFVFEPLEIGFGHTLGTAMRRVLYTSLTGSSITSVKIDGAKHQFATLPGMREDMVELILNMKLVAVRYRGENPATMNLSVKGPREVKAKDIEVSDGIEIVNPDLVLANLNKEGRLEIEFTVESGRGYSPADERKTDTIGVIPIDAIFTPVVKVNYSVMSTRVGRVTNYDKLVLEITTDGTVAPTVAVKEAAQVLVNFFNQIVSPVEEKVEEVVTTPAAMNDILRLTVEELDLPTRIANALRKGGYENVADLIKSTKVEIAKVKNLGTKSVKIIEVSLKEKGLELPG